MDLHNIKKKRKFHQKYEGMKYLLRSPPPPPPMSKHGGCASRHSPVSYATVSEDL